MKNKKSTIVIIVVILLVIIIVLIARSVNKKKNTTIEDQFAWPDNFTESALEAKKQEEEVHANIKKAIDAVEKDYQTAYSNYSGYIRSDFYNKQRLNEQMENGEIEFINSDEINLDCMYDLGGIKIDAIPSIASNLADENSFNTGNLLLRCRSNFGTYTFYYLVTISGKGLEKYNYVFYTEDESFYDFELENMDELNDLEKLGL